MTGEPCVPLGLRRPAAAQVDTTTGVAHFPNAKWNSERRRIARSKISSPGEREGRPRKTRRHETRSTWARHRWRTVGYRGEDRFGTTVFSARRCSHFLLFVSSLSHSVSLSSSHSLGVFCSLTHRYHPLSIKRVTFFFFTAREKNNNDIIAN